jgi:hypothetical protein
MLGKCSLCVAVGAVATVSLGVYLVWTRYGGGYGRPPATVAGGTYGPGYGGTAGAPGGTYGGGYGGSAGTAGGLYGGGYGGSAGTAGGAYGGGYGGSAGTAGEPYGGGYRGSAGTGGDYGPGYGGSAGTAGAYGPGHGGTAGTAGGTYGGGHGGTAGGSFGAGHGGTAGAPGAANSAGHGGTAGTAGGTYGAGHGGTAGTAYGGGYGRTNGTTGGLEDSPYDPVLNPRDFVSWVNNRYFRLRPGTVFTYEKRTLAGTERSEIEVTREKRRVMGVLTTVVRHTTWLNGQLKEETRDWYAQDRRGNVWYFGEAVDNYENGRLMDHRGSWEAGVNGAKPGIVMLNNPVVGLAYRQEFYKGEAEDMGSVVALDKTVTVSSGTYRGCVQTRDWSPIDRTEKEYKYYCPQIGFLALEEAAPHGGESGQLISVSTAGGNVFNGQRSAYGRRGDD